MSDTELLLKEIEGLPANYMGEILDFVGYLKHKAPPGNPAVSLLDLRGSCKGIDTMDAYFERKRADKALEDTE
jgi:hypothetical protein